MIVICEVLYKKNKVRRSVRFSLDFTQMRHKSSANDTQELGVSKQQERTQTQMPKPYYTGHARSIEVTQMASSLSEKQGSGKIMSRSNQGGAIKSSQQINHKKRLSHRKTRPSFCCKMSGNFLLQRVEDEGMEELAKTSSTLAAFDNISTSKLTRIKKNE